MAIIYKCDKCGKTIKERINTNSLYYTTLGGHEIRAEYNLPDSFVLCHACSRILAKAMAKFFNSNTGKKS